MSDNSVVARGNSHSQEPATGTAKPAREPVSRRIYIPMRLEEIGVEIAAKANEREKLTLELKDLSDADGLTQRKSRQRRAYVAERLAALRTEQADLNAEKKASAPVGRPAQKGGLKIRPSDAPETV